MAPLCITVAGKGGTGKTVIAGTLARVMGRAGRRVLAVDLDSNPMLAISLGVPLARLDDLVPIPTDFWQAVERIGVGRVAVLNDDPHELTRRHAVDAPDNVTLLAGRVVDNGGCTPAAGVRGMLGILLGHHLFERVVTDFEAGVDEPAWALGGSFNPADTLLVVATPSPVAIRTAAKIVRLATERDIARIYGIANQVREDSEATRIADAFEAAGASCVATVPWDGTVAFADVEGSAVLDAEAPSAAIRAVEGLAELLERDAALVA
ncbi:MAG TPA: cellulose synthase operon protein YhjQ/BcsQ [Candidatus Dormibacteraeota bacterium]|nr:cellulose synthase operon protein YhjQ/BcsQ [Candidatus Dormibacteraeota bacterium]